MALAGLKIDELSVVAELLSKALTHHEPEAVDPRSFPPATLANDAARNPSIVSGLLGELFANPALLAMIVGLVTNLIKRPVTALPPVAAPEPVAPVAPPVAAPAPAGPVIGPSVMPNGFGIDIDEVFGPNRTGRVQRNFRVADPATDGDPYTLVMLEADGSPDDTTSLDDQSGLVLSGILFLDGVAVPIETVPSAADKVYFKVMNVDTGQENVVKFQSPGVGMATTNEHSTNWRVDEFVRTRGFNPVLHLHDKSAAGYDITFGVEGIGEAVPIRTPAVN